MYNDLKYIQELLWIEEFNEITLEILQDYVGELILKVAIEEGKVYELLTDFSAMYTVDDNKGEYYE